MGRPTHYHLNCCSLGTPLQYSCLENPRDGGAWWAAVYGVAQSWTRLKRLSSSSSSSSGKMTRRKRTRSYRNSPQILPLECRPRNEGCIGHVALKYGFQFQRRRDPGQRMPGQRRKKKSGFGLETIVLFSAFNKNPNILGKYTSSITNPHAQVMLIPLA